MVFMARPSAGWTFWLAEYFINEEVDEGYWDIGVGKFAVLCLC